jgi:ribosomal protein S18 acetylase RimI-like enzyme
LVLRRARREDTEALVAFNIGIHEEDESGFGEPIGVWTRDLMSGGHPLMDAQDFTLVEDTGTGKIVSSLNLIPQTWTFGGIPFGVGRVELVGTDPEYRQRGLVRAQMETVHRWSEKQGHLLQAITGIPWFYRQFGYAMGLTLGGSRAGFPTSIPALEKDAEEPYRVRPAVEEDVSFIVEVDAQAARRHLVYCARSEDHWRYEISGRQVDNVNRREICILEDTAGDPVGYLLQGPFLVKGRVWASGFELKEAVSWADVTPAVLRHLRETGEALARQKETEAGPEKLKEIGLNLGANHPAYALARDWLPREGKPYAWYLRMPDIGAFLQLIRPVLEARLADSPLRGGTNTLAIHFYKTGLRLKFEAGRLEEISSWDPKVEKDGDAAFPEFTFLQLLFGYRTMDELDYAFADCWTENDLIRAWLNALFPKQPSNVWPID